MTREAIYLKNRGALAFSLSVHAQPGAKKEGIAGIYGESLKIKIGAAPMEGAANEALIRFLAKFFAIPSRQVTLERGAQSREKVFLIEGVGCEKAAELIQGALEKSAP